jgi:hypothetical protein
MKNVVRGSWVVVRERRVPRREAGGDSTQSGGGRREAGAWRRKGHAPTSIAVGLAWPAFSAQRHPGESQGPGWGCGARANGDAASRLAPPPALGPGFRRDDDLGWTGIEAGGWEGAVAAAPSLRSSCHRGGAIRAACVVAVLAIAPFLHAQSGPTYWVSPTGAASWANARSATPLSGAACCSLATANANVQAGDTVYLRGGTYYPTGRNYCIHPGRSGTPGNRITYQNHSGETVIVDGANSSSEAILFCAGYDTGNPADGRNYITVREIHFAHWNQLGELRFASYNEIADCVFSGHKGDGTGVDYNGFFLYQQSAHNWIHGNAWHTFGHYVGRDQGVILNIGHDNAGNASNSGNDHNTVEDNQFYAGGHHVVGVNNAKFNVIRNNYIHNEGWSTTGACADWPTGVCGYRVMSMTDGSGLDVAGSNLLERNSVAYGAQYGGPHLVSGTSGGGLTVATGKNIVRYNTFFGNVLYGIRIGSSFGGASAASGNRIYNNTFFYLGYNFDSFGVVNEDDAQLTAFGDDFRRAFIFYSPSCVGYFEDNVIRNNLADTIWSETNRLSGTGYYPAFEGPGESACNNTVAGNWGNTGNRQNVPFAPYPDPKFVDRDISNPMALTLSSGKWTGKPNLSLQADSPVIDNAGPLTQASTAGSSSTTLVVDDAKYFQDGTWGSDLARAALHADWIAIGTVSNVASIAAINYAANSITLAAPMTWDAGAPIWLYRDSSGRVVLHGSAPDLGAFEYLPVAPGGFVPVTPCRVLDTRVSTGAGAAAPALAADDRRVFVIGGACGIPAGARAISANATVVGAGALGDLRVTGGHLTSTTTSALSIPLARARANNALIQLSTSGDGTIAVTNDSAGSVHFILDVNGYFQ